MGVDYGPLAIFFAVNFLTPGLPIVRVVAATTAFIIATVASYHGFFVAGGSLEVGRSSTRAVVHSSIIILMFNLLLTKLLL